MIEHLLDEALVNALRRGSLAMTYADIEHARITEMVGIGQPVRYTDARAAAHRHPRGRPRRHRVARGTEPDPRGADDHPPRRRARAARARRLRGGLDALALRPARPGADRDGRLGGRGAVLRADQHRDLPGTSPSATRTAAQMVGAAGMTGSLISFAATPHDLVSAVLADAQARAQLEAVLDDARDHRAAAAVPAPPPGRGAAGRAAGAARAHRRRRSPTSSRRRRWRRSSCSRRRRTSRTGRRGGCRRRCGGAAARGLAFGACPRVIPSTASPASSPRTSSVDGSPSAPRRAGSRPARRGSTARSSWLRTPSASSCSARSSPVTSCACTWACTARGTSTGRSRRWCRAGSPPGAWVRRGCAGPCGWARTSGKVPRRKAGSSRRSRPTRSDRCGCGSRPTRPSPTCADRRRARSSTRPARRRRSSGSDRTRRRPTTSPRPAT